MDALPRIVAEGRWRLLALLVANGVGRAIAAIVAALAVELGAPVALRSPRMGRL